MDKQQSYSVIDGIELKMLTWMCGVTGMDRMKNDKTRGRDRSVKDPREKIIEVLICYAKG